MRCRSSIFCRSVCNVEGEAPVPVRTCRPVIARGARFPLLALPGVLCPTVEPSESTPAGPSDKEAAGERGDAQL